MAARDYVDHLKREFTGLIDELSLDPAKKRFLVSRWLDQVVWMEGKASKAQKHYYRLRLITVVGAVVVPALVSASALDAEFVGLELGAVGKVATWVVSLVVAVSAAIEGFFRFGERWRNYRGTVERLKMEGWLFFQLAGPYSADGATHEAAYSAFASRVEELIKSDVEVYLTEVAVEKERQKEAAQAG